MSSKIDFGCLVTPLSDILHVLLAEHAPGDRMRVDCMEEIGYIRLQNHRMTRKDSELFCWSSIEIDAYKSTTVLEVWLGIIKANLRAVDCFADFSTVVGNDP